ncbi:MAG: DUF308 domain-containing protein [Promethearchaeota archaeon]
MSKTEKQKRFRSSNILIGLLMIIFSILAIMYPDAANLGVALLLSFVLLLAGFVRLINAVSDEKLSNVKVISRFISGIFALVISIIAIVMIISDPITALDWWYFLIAIALLITGIARIVLGASAKEFDQWFRILVLIIGILTLIFSIIVLVIPDLAGIYIVVLIALSMMINGIIKIILGIIGPKSK